MGYTILNFYWSLIGFSVLMTVLGLCIPMFETIIKCLEDKAHDDESQPQVDSR